MLVRCCIPKGDKKNIIELEGGWIWDCLGGLTLLFWVAVNKRPKSAGKVKGKKVYLLKQ